MTRTILGYCILLGMTFSLVLFTNFAQAKSSVTKGYIDLGVTPHYHTSTKSSYNGKPLVSYSDGPILTFGGEYELLTYLSFFAELNARYHFFTAQYRSQFNGIYTEIEDHSGVKLESGVSIGLRFNVYNALSFAAGVYMGSAEYTSSVILPSDIGGAPVDPVTRKNTIHTTSYFSEIAIGFKISETILQAVARVEQYQVNNIPNFNNQEELGLRPSFRLRIGFER